MHDHVVNFRLPNELRGGVTLDILIRVNAGESHVERYSKST